jgi:hypothetical protein
MSLIYFFLNGNDVLGEAEMVVEEVETVAEVVEKVASAAEKISAEVADKLPAKGKLKEAALFVEHVSEEAVRDAQLTEDFIRKVFNYKYFLVRSLIFDTIYEFDMNTI